MPENWALVEKAEYYYIAVSTRLVQVVHVLVFSFGSFHKVWKVVASYMHVCIRCDVREVIQVVQLIL